MRLKRKRGRAPTRRDTLAPAVHANRGVEAWYRRQLQGVLDDMNRSLTLHVLAAWKSAPPSIGLAQDAKRSPTKALRDALDRWGGQWVERLDAMAAEIATRFATKAATATQAGMMAAFKQAGFTVEFRPTAASLEAYKTVIEYNVGLIRTIPQQYLAEVRTHVWQSVIDGADLHTVSRKIQDTYNKSAKRAALIARDQNNKAKAIIEATRRQELGITEAIWQHSGGGKEPRPTHVEAGRKRVRFKLSEGWRDPAVGKYIWPGTEINCRCTSRSVIPGFVD